MSAEPASGRDRLRVAADTPALVLDEDGEPVEALALARAKLRLPTLRRVVKRGRLESLFDLELDDGTLIEVGPVGAIKDPRQLEDRIADSLGKFPPYYPPKAFRPVANALLAIAELEDNGVTAGNVTRAWIAQYIADRIGPEKIDLTTAAGRARVVANRPEPFRSTDGRLYIGCEDLEHYVRTARRVPTTLRDMAARLARLGFEPVQVTAPRPERKRARFHASLPDWDPEDDA